VAISIPVEINRTFGVKADFDKVFDTLANVPESVGNFPKVDQLVPLGNNAFRWEMHKIGVDKHALQTVYACIYHMDRDNGVITWEPVEGVGNSRVSGSWHVKREGNQTQLKFSTKARVELPLPSLLKLAISPVVKHEFAGLIDTYIENLKKKFS
jgi:carbon monoxide dehydrogenase subunit G